jgi:hypothetical protein
MGEILPCTAHRVQTTSAVFEKSHACTSIGHKEILSSFLIHQPQPESKETSIDETMQKFSEAFLNASREHPEGFVGRVILARILKSLDITDTPRKLIRDGMLEAVIPKKIGQKIGWYRSGPKMVSDIKSSPEPRNDYERAQIAIARKPSLLAEIEQLERRLQEVNNELHKIEQIELFLTKIGAILE